MNTMDRSAVVVALALGLAAPLTAVAEAGREPVPPTPQVEDEEIVWLGEAATGRYAGDWDRDDISVVDRRWVLTVVDTANGTGGTFRWFHTRAGSRFFVDYCDDEGPYSLRVSRRVFAQRAAEDLAYWEVEYDAERNRGEFVLRRDVVMDEPCEFRERREGDELTPLPPFPD